MIWELNNWIRVLSLDDCYVQSLDYLSNSEASQVLIDPGLKKNKQKSFDSFQVDMN